MIAKEYILNALQREYTFKSGVDVETIDFVEEGYLNSLAIIQFVVELEDEFNIEFSEEELNDPDFRVVGKLVELVEKKVGTA